MALNIPNQSNIPNANDAKAGFASILGKIKDLFASPLTASIVVLAFILGYFFDWWTVAIAKGTAAVSTLWLLMVWYHHFSTQGILSNKIAQILPVGGNVGILITATVLIGGLVGGWAAMSGFLVRNLFRK
jgi:hypothetical protein